MSSHYLRILWQFPNPVHLQIGAQRSDQQTVKHQHPDHQHNDIQAKI